MMTGLPLLGEGSGGRQSPRGEQEGLSEHGRSARGAFSGRRGAQHMQSEPSSAMEARPRRLPHVRATKGRRPGPWGFSASPGCAPSRRWRRGRAPAARRGWPAGGWRRGSRRSSSRRGGGRLTGLLAEGFGGDGGCKRSQGSNHPNLLSRLRYFKISTYSCTRLKSRSIYYTTAV
jgi:hypothetical protein